jgi:very-short-patch-repair endonuclease
MSADFVICTKDATVLAVIELDDSSHQKDRRKATDNKKERALVAAGIKLIRWQARELPDDAVIRSALLPKLSLNPGASPAGLPRRPLGAG